MTSEWLAWVPMIVTNVALVRVGWVLMGHLRTFLNRRRRVHFQLSAVEAVTTPEPLVLAIVAVVVGAFEPTDGAGGLLVGLGFAASLAGLAVSLAAFLAFPNIGTGHYVDSDQRVVRRGIYHWVRHPIYLGVLLIWLGLALGCSSVLAGLVTVVYVLPAYVAYMRSEEEMMSAHFGEEYHRYCAEVGGLWPRRSHSPR